MSGVLFKDGVHLNVDSYEQAKELDALTLNNPNRIKEYHIKNHNYDLTIRIDKILAVFAKKAVWKEGTENLSGSS